MKRILLYVASLLFLFSDILYSDVFEGYVRQIDVSFCMDECSQYFIEDEFGNYITNISFDNIDSSLYIDRYVELEGEEEIWCVECGALLLQSISLSSECEMPVDCFVNPCEVASECQINTPVECYPNYCGGCYADFYDLEGNLVDCYAPPSIDICYDINGLSFGMCDMFMGFAVIGDGCEGVSGCGWIIDGVDYSDAFFQNIEDCEESCFNSNVCEDVEYDYNQYFSSEITSCEFNIDCIPIWGDCDVGLGGCHYSVNPNLFNENIVNDLIDLWIENDCSGGVCDCLGLPNPVCNDGNCELAYCYDENPEGCFSSGCAEGYQCIDDPNNCTPSSCFCDESNLYGNWYCTEDCGGGTCVPFLSGDANYDGFLNVADIIIIVNMILNIIPFDFIADMNFDETIDIIDIVSIISIILDN